MNQYFSVVALTLTNGVGNLIGALQNKIFDPFVKHVTYINWLTNLIRLFNYSATTQRTVFRISGKAIKWSLSNLFGAKAYSVAILNTTTSWFDWNILCFNYADSAYNYCLSDIASYVYL